jgi:hypothetical protein
MPADLSLIFFLFHFDDLPDESSRFYGREI